MSALVKGLRLLWVVANNTKTGAIPSAYVGADTVEAWESCEGCALREDGTCYAWNGLNAVAFQSQHVKGFAVRPKRYSLESVLERIGKGIYAKHPKVRAARIGVLGDPSRADRGGLLGAIEKLRKLAFAILGYTHFWREEGNQDLRGELMASCNGPEEADEAIKRGWRPATVLPWWHEGKRFTTPGGAPGVVCPAQTKDPVTCNSCRMCDPRHPVWSAGKVQVIGFIDHSHKARAAQKRATTERTLELYAEPEDVVPWKAGERSGFVDRTRPQRVRPLPPSNPTLPLF